MSYPSLVTVTLNPALDLTGSLDSLATGQVNRVQSSNLRAAGKGINVALVVTELAERDLAARVPGFPVVATGILGRDNQTPFVDLFERYGVEDNFVRENGNTRINVKLGENSGRVTDINFPGIHVSPESLGQLRQQLLQLTQHHETFVLAGSLPASIPTETWANLVELLKAEGKQVILDTSGDALKSALNSEGAKPSLIKPNEIELSELVGHECLTIDVQRIAAHQLISEGTDNVVVSNGEAGVSWYWQTGELHARAPSQKVVSTVGAGDSLVAGLSFGLASGLPREVCLRLGTSVAALAVTQIAVGIPSTEIFAQMKQQVEISDKPFL